MTLLNLKTVYTSHNIYGDQIKNKVYGLREKE
jgi:hypothetical protein